MYPFSGTVVFQSQVQIGLSDIISEMATIRKIALYHNGLIIPAPERVVDLKVMGSGFVDRIVK